MRIAQIREIDIANGVGTRVSVFVSGCTHNCKGCFNKKYQSFNYGEKYNKDIRNKIIDILKPNYIDGITILGGEPFDNKEMVLDIVKIVRKEYGNKKNIWIYSGYVLEDLLKDEISRRILTLIDILVDGKFILEKKDLKLAFRGSSNQRIIDVKNQKDISYKFDMQK